MLDHSGRDTAHDRIRRYTLSNNRSGGYDRAIFDDHTGENRGVGADPYIFPYHNRSRMIVYPMGWIKIVVDGCQHHIMANERTVPDGYTALILKMASGIDKHIFANVNIFPEVCVKGRKQAKAVIHFFPDDF